MPNAKTPNPKTILIVDDSITNRLILSKILEDRYNTLEAENGKIALEILEEKNEEIAAVLLDISMPEMDGYETLRRIRAHKTLSHMPVIMITGSEGEESRVKSLALGANDYVIKPYNPEIIRHCLENNIAFHEATETVSILQRDRLTGLFNRDAFFDSVQEMISSHEPGYYLLSCFDIDNFKLINEQYGTNEGDRILCEVARTVKEDMKEVDGVAGRIGGDNFAVLMPTEKKDFSISRIVRQNRMAFSPKQSIVFSIGRCIVSDKNMPANIIYDRAVIAKQSVKGRYDKHIAYFDEAMLEKLVKTRDITSDVDMALKERQFEVWYQPQYNHSNSALIGAEALVRWRHPENGLIPPNDFIPIFENNGFIFDLDKYVWGEVCSNLRKWLDAGWAPVPISVNISRYDIFKPELVGVIIELLERYDLPIELLRLEITESAFTESSQQIIEVVSQFIELGFIVEIDDFGSGYSSLNTLKDVPAQIIKLDMHFLDKNSDSKRGGNIMESIVRMAKWLGMSVIAEGVETIEQADYLRSIGCSYIQGYLYAKPMPLSQYEALATNVDKEKNLLVLETVENLDNNSFWDPDSMDTLIFNSYVGAACIYEYHNGSIEILRATEKYAHTVGGETMTVEDVLSIDWSEHLDEKTKTRVEAEILKAAETKDEVAGEYIFHNLPGCPDETYLKTTTRVIASVGDRYLVYCINENITKHKKADNEIKRLSSRLQAIMDNIDLGIIVVAFDNDNAHFMFGNNRYYEMLGYTKEQFDKEIKSPYDTVAEEDRQYTKAKTEELNETGKPITMVYTAITRSGEKRKFRATITMSYIEGVKEQLQFTALRDITEEFATEQREKRTLETLSFISSMSHELLAEEDVQQGITSALDKLNKYFKGIRAYIFEFDYLSETTSNTYEVCSEGTAPEIDNLQNVPLSIMEYWFEAFDKQGYYFVEDINMLDDSRAKEREMLLAQGMTSLFVIPLKREDKIIGMMGVDEPRKIEIDAARLEVLGNYMSVMLTRRDLKARVLKEKATGDV